ncbi:10086_t:CDS:2 [Funneliformis geosporum]|nr:10086_t:CDS:2 [Funneliformis geosporum]
MPNIDNLATKSFTKNSRNNSLLQAHREDILYREDLRTGFFYALIGITIALAVAGSLYVVEAVSNSTDPDPITKYQQRIVKTEVLNHAKSVPNSSEQSESTSH